MKAIAAAHVGDEARLARHRLPVEDRQRPVLVGREEGDDGPLQGLAVDVAKSVTDDPRVVIDTLPARGWRPFYPPLSGVMSCGQADIATITSVSARVRSSRSLGSCRSIGWILYSSRR